MKNLFMLGVIASLLCSCSKEDDYIANQDVEFNLSYTFAESGSMTRASGADVYGEFYDKYIKTKLLTPTTYSLTFSNSNGETVMTTSGNGVKKIILGSQKVNIRYMVLLVQLCLSLKQSLIKLTMCTFLQIQYI